MRNVQQRNVCSSTVRKQKNVRILFTFSTSRGRERENSRRSRRRRRIEIDYKSSIHIRGKLIKMYIWRKIATSLLLSSLTIGTMCEASPLARFHLKILRHPHVEEHGYAVEDLRSGNNLYHHPGNYNYQRIIPLPKLLRFSDGTIDESYDSHDRYSSPDFSNGLGEYLNNFDLTLIKSSILIYFVSFADYPDPLLLRGDAALRAVSYIYGRGQLYYSDVPHTRALLRLQAERRQNGLRDNLLSSLRPGSAWLDYYRPAY
ncbi:unnamed protein product [Trichogramma brassicae]|uniref:Uncharacterized protein n=1 Tax=Trichogramma brassicae TaxID=86971 RepID=A0A6H5I8X4_9HYME|nr:unnamed protein product [Trichogramma brassicae]